MKNNKNIPLFLIIIVVIILILITKFFYSNNNSKEKNIDNFEIKPISNEYITNLKKSMYIQVLDKEYLLDGIAKFDVSKTGLIAISSETLGTEKIISIYNSNGEYQIGFKFDVDGEYYIKWKDATLGIHSVRSDSISFIDLNGKYISFGEVLDNRKNEEIFNALDKPIRQALNKTYYLEKNIGLAGFLTNSYSNLVIEEENGKRNIIYDVSENLAKSIIINVVIPAVIFIIIVYFAIKHFVEINKIEKLE